MADKHISAEVTEEVIDGEPVDVGAAMGDARWRPHTDRMGDPKVRFDTEEKARERAQELSDADLFNGMAFRRTPAAYPCSDPECGGWHVGNWSDKAYQDATRG
jgi:hypothetical protein